VDELERLRQRALAELGEHYAGDPTEDTKLLRRQIARRCIFGVDLNPMAVELARLSIWIHTFVPGLPLSFLDANLIVGNSLVGIATFEEARDLLGADTGDLFSMSAEERLAKARPIMEQLGRLADATAAEVTQARELYLEARRRIQPEEDLLTVLTASRVNEDIAGKVKDGVVSTRSEADVFTDALVRQADKALAGLQPVHFPIVFPQVFLGSRGGFDVIVGNPPWEKKRVEELEFWARHSPGLRGLGTGARNTAIETLQAERPDLARQLEAEKLETAVLRGLLRGFPGMNTGHPDLFRAFAWRFTQLLAPDAGRLGAVLPGDSFKIKGATRVREVLATHFARLDLLMLTNKGQWVFDAVHGQKLVVLIAAERALQVKRCVYILRQEIHDPSKWAQAAEEGFEVTDDWILRFSPTRVVPIIPSPGSVAIINSLMRLPRLGDHPSFPVARVYADFETYKDKHRWFAEKRTDSWPVYKGESFDLWEPDTGRYFGFTHGESIAVAVHQRRLRSKSAGPYAKTLAAWRQDPATHPVHFPRIAFRNVTNRTNRRTLIAALIPRNVVTTETAPWILWYNEEQRAEKEALLLGILSSRPLDWWVRRFVEGHVDEEAFDSLPIPVIEVAHPLAQVIISASARLAAHDDRFLAWAAALGVESGPMPDDDKDELAARIDAAVALTYDLSPPQLTHMFETFHEGWDHEKHLAATLKHYRHLRGLV
jgi:hypothetical protein